MQLFHVTIATITTITTKGFCIVDAQGCTDCTDRITFGCQRSFAYCILNAQKVLIMMQDQQSWCTEDVQKKWSLCLPCFFLHLITYYAS